MLGQIASLLVESLGNLFVYVLLLRFHMQWLRAPFRNPIGEFIAALTNWIVMPMRRAIPGLFGLDLATLFTALLAEALMLALLMSIRGYPFAMVFTVARILIPIPAILHTGFVGIEIVVWSAIALAAFLPSVLLDWRAIFPRPAAKTAARNPLRKTAVKGSTSVKPSTAAKTKSSGSSVAKRMAKAVSRLSASSAAASVPGTNGSGSLTVVR